MKTDSVSICIPVYNGEKYLSQCIESCLHQSIPPLEIIVCDDGSTDKSKEILAEYKEKYPIIKLHINERNLGLVGNWNRCVELASGDWIKFVFQDDYIEKNCLEKFLRAAQIEDKLLVCKRNFIIDKQATADELDYYQNRVRTLENTGFYESDFFEPEIISKIGARHIYMNFIAEPSLVMFCRQTAIDMGLFDADLKQICDYEFFLRMASQYGLRYIPEKLASFRIHSRSTTEKNVHLQASFANKYLEIPLLVIKLLSDKTFINFRKYLSYVDKLRLSWFVKFKLYQAKKAAKNTQEREIYTDFIKKYEPFNYKTFQIPFLALLNRLF